MIYKEEKPAILLLEDGSYFEGIGVGASKQIMGEITFSTVPGSGYIEALTDFTYTDKILVFTYPSIGNYGVPKKEHDDHGILKHFESDTIKVSGVVMNEYCATPSHHESVKALETWLIEENIPGIQWIDTRRLIQRLVREERTFGCLKVFETEQKPDLEKMMENLKKFPKESDRLLVSKISTPQTQKFTPLDPKATIIILDLGTKNGIIRTLLSKNLEIIKVPYSFDYERIAALNPAGVIISNGPGNPAYLENPIHLVRELIKNDIPTMGIGLGNMILGLAAGMDIYKMDAEHRGGRTTVENATDQCYITAQNHGYCLKYSNLNGFKELYYDKDDKSNEGLIHEDKPIFSVAFNPEGSPGPLDMREKIFNQFVELLEV
ncbi:MAG: glutamine-hydrolyzing carbamoyl-phosphate synthase small subunit [Candidatus Lokiarchaeota archaeon]|nr:glutamine-hydrolyzing carbamoyl-phosphate synthase small subunit [Candidatus Lokiarchaeota archaeon]